MQCVQVVKQSRTAAILVSFLPTGSTGKAKMLQAANLTPLMTALQDVYARVTKFQANSRTEISSKHFQAYSAIKKPLSKARDLLLCVYACVCGCVCERERERE